MDNHVHLVLKEGVDPIARIMKRIATSYARFFNLKYERVGHVFQDRYKSILRVGKQIINFLRLMKY